MRASSHRPRTNNQSAGDAPLTEAIRFLEAGERVLAHSLMFGDDVEVREGAEHMVTMTARARGFLELAAVA